MRNKLVHGQQVYNQEKCETYAKHTIAALKKLHSTIRNDYRTDPWATLMRRTKPKLEWHPVNNSPSEKRHVAKNKKAKQTRKK
jgi:hypothetical protein